MTRLSDGSSASVKLETRHFYLSWPPNTDTEFARDMNFRIGLLVSYGEKSVQCEPVNLAFGGLLHSTMQSAADYYNLNKELQ